MTPLCFSLLLFSCLLDPFLHHSRNLEIVLLQEQEMTVTMDVDFPELDPVHLHSGLSQVVDDALVIRDVG